MGIYSTFNMKAKKLSNYWDRLEKENKKTIATISLSGLGLLLFIAIAITLPFKDALYSTLFPKPKVIAALVPQYIQSAVANPTSAATSITTSWPAPTADGNLLVAVLSIKSATAGIIITPPANWTQSAQASNGAGLYQWTFYYANAPSQSGALSFTINNSVKGTLAIAEYKDVEKINPFDTQNSVNGSGTSVDGTVTPAGSDEFIIAAYTADGATTYSSPSAGFTLATQTASTTGSDGTTTGLTHYFSASAGQINNSITIATASAWINTSLAFKAAPAPTPTPTIALTPTPAPVSTEWSQDAHDAQRTGYSPVEPTTPWTLAWTWNGSNATGGVSGHFYDTPREARTVTGGGNVYVPAGSQGLYALSKSNGAQAWNVNVTGFNATPAYDSSGYVYAGGANGTFYKINASSGTISGTYVAGSGLNKSVLLVGAFAYIVTDSGELHKVDASTMARTWLYAAGSTIATPPSYSATRDTIIYTTDDLFVHAVNNSDGTRKWRVKPSPNSPGNETATPVLQTYGGVKTGNQFELGWPVIADKSGVVFVRMQLPLQAHFEGPNGGRFANTNAENRTWLQQNPQYKNLFALNLDTGSEQFIPAVGYGSTEDWINDPAAYGVMGSQPVVKVWPDGKEVAYIHFRNGQTNPPTDFRWSGHMGEMVLDDTTISGLTAGDLRFIRMSNYNGYGGNSYVHIIDEQDPITLAGDSIFHSHWAAAESVKITDRSATRGLTYATPIEITKHTPILRAQVACGTQNATTHYSTCGMSYVTDGGRFYDAPGFWNYWNVADPPGWRVGSGNTAGTSYSAGFQARYTYVSNGIMIVQGNGGDIMAFTYSGAPTPVPTNTPTPGGPTNTSTPIPPTATPTPLPPTNTPTPTPTPGAGGSTTVTLQVNASAGDVNEDGAGYDATSANAWLGTGASATASYTGLHFTNISIPQGATISSAKLQIVSPSSQWNSYSFTYGIEASGNSVTFSTTNKPSQRILGSQTATHNDNVQWLANTPYTLDEIAPVVQSVINRADWASGNSLSIILKGTGSAFGRKFIQSFDGSAVNAPKLVVAYASGPAGTPTSTPTPLPPTNTPTPALTFSISGNLYVDVNRNGVKDTGEANYNGATITIQGGASRTTTTDASGNYLFTALAAGFYGVTLTAPATYEATTTNPVNTTISADTTINFGMALAPTPTPGGATATPTPTSAPVTTASFTTGKAGFIDAIPRQLVRTNTDQLYMFAGRAEGSGVLQAYWTGTGLPSASTSFTGTASITDSAAILSADTAYDGGNIIHVLVNTNSGTVKDYPFDISTNSFKTPLIASLSTGNPTVSGNYIGTQGVSSMIDTAGKLHVAYWSTTNHITYRAYTYNAGANTLTLTDGPTQLDSVGPANHPTLVISPIDGLVTVAWVGENTTPARILTRTRASSGTWGAIQTATTGNVWVSTNFGINIDQGPSLVIDSANNKHMVYMENFDGTGDYGKLHYVTQLAGSATWTDTPLTTYSHAAAIAINSANELYIIGHGHPNSTTSVTACKSMLYMCYIKKTGSTWGQQQLLLTASGSDSLDASVSVKWGVVGWNRPETIELLYFAALNGSYQNTEIYYGRFAGAAAPTATSVPPTSTPTPVPTYTLSGNVFIDTNQNGAKDAGETDYQGASISLNTAPVQNSTTNASGIYTFTNIPASTYTVTLTLPGNYAATTTNPLSIPMSQNYANAHFGIAQGVGELTISNIVSNTSSVRVYEKYEVKFDVATNAPELFMQYDENPPSGVAPRTGITVEAIFTANGKTWKQPAFYMTETVKVGSGSSAYYEETERKYWVVRFSPQEIGTYQVSLSARDATGTTTVLAGSFTATAPVKKGFIKVSQQDKRYFEYSNGELFWPVGPANGTNYSQYKDTGMNLERPWMGGRGAYSTNWSRWKSSAENLGNEGIMTRLNWREKYPGHDLSYEIFYPLGYRMWLTTWGDESFGPRIKAGKTYDVKVTLKTANIAGPRNSGFPYGFVVRDAPAQWGSMTNDQFDANVRSAPRIINHITTNQGWQTITTTYTANANNESIYLYLDNVTAGEVYIDEFSMRERLTDGSLGGEIIRNPRADQHTYVEQRPAAFFDDQVQQGEQYGVNFKYVVHDKNDWIQNHLLSNGQWADTGVGYYQDENTKARWLLRQWYRYIIARWGYSTAIHSWELNNEGPPNEDAPGTSAHWRTAQAFAKFMHDNDSHRHLVTTSFWCCWRPTFWGNNTSFPDIDYADVHEYTSTKLEGATYPTDFLDDAGWGLNSSLHVYNQGYPSGQKGVGKPVIRAETGPDPSQAIFTTLKQPNPGIWFHNLLWAGLNEGAMFDAGYWWSEHFAAINTTQVSKPFYDFVKDLDVHKGGYVDLAPSSSNTKIRVIGQKNLSTNKTFFWVQNTDHTWKNVMDGINSTQSGTLTIRMNPNINYKVDRWNTYTGVVSSTQTVASNASGDVVLAISGLTDDVGVKIESSAVPTATPTPISTLAPTTEPTATPTPVPPTATPTPIPTYNLSGNVFVDSNRNGAKDTGETDYQGALLSLSTTPVQTATTSASGVYAFISIQAATNTLTLTIPTGYTATTTNPVTVALAANTTQNFGIVQTPSATPSPTPSSSSAEWPQLQHDAQKTGKTSSFVVPDYEVAWAWIDKNHIVKNFVSASGNSITDGFEPGFKFTTLFSGQLQPIVYSGKAYFGSMNGTMYAVNALTGDNSWEFASNGSILGSAAADQGILIFGSMDGKVYGLNANTGIKIWEYQTGAGVNAAPIVSNSTVYVGSRDGSFYALDVTNGALRWKYDTRDVNNTFNKAPIVAPAAVSEDGATVFFGAENMYLYALNTSNGTEKWPPKKLIGQSFLYTWPVVKGDKVIVRTMSSLEGAEFLMESVLDGLSADPTITEEKTATLNWISQNPNQKTMYVFDINTGVEPYQVAMGRVTGNNYPAHIAVVDNLDRALTYWRSKRATLLRDEPPFGSKYCPDISAIDLLTGDRIKLTNSLANSSRMHCPELDNGFQPTIGGSWMYLHNHFRGAKAVNVTTGSNRGIAGTFACRDGACWRGGNGDGIWGYQIIYYGNDAAGPNPTSLPRPPLLYENTQGFAGIAIAQTSGTTMLYINEGDLPGIVAIRHKP